MLDFFKSLFKTQGSGATAKERLRLVLLSDHLSLSPDMIDALKADLFDVFSRYFEYDAKQAEVTFDHREREVAMLASVPILRVRERPVVREPFVETIAPAPLVAAAPEPVVAEPVAAEPVVAAAEPLADVVEPEAEAAPAAAETANAPELLVSPVPRTPRKRRRKRNGAAGKAPGAPQPLSMGHSAQA